MKKKVLTALMITVIGAVTFTGCGQREEGEVSGVETVVADENQIDESTADGSESGESTEEVEVKETETESQVVEEENKEKKYVLVKERQYWMNSQEEMELGIEYTYEHDENGNVIKATDADGNLQMNDYQYDENGNMISRAYGDSGTYELFEYDDYNNRTLWVMISGDEEILRYRYENEYDDEGKLTSRLKIMVREEGYDDFATKEIYTYDENGRLLNKDEHLDNYDPNKPELTYICTYTYEYDSNGNCIMESCNDSIGFRYEYEYELR